MTSRKLLIDAEAEREAREAFLWYAERDLAVAERFEAEFIACVDDIAVHPFAAPVFDERVHRRLLGNFPYGVLYTVDDQRIVILAVMHLHRRPGYWKDRI